jgi:hypothetical protein
MPKNKTMYTWNPDQTPTFKNEANGPPKPEPPDKSITVGFVHPAQEHPGLRYPLPLAADMEASRERSKQRKADSIIDALLEDFRLGWGFRISDESRERWVKLVMMKL